MNTYFDTMQQLANKPPVELEQWRHNETQHKYLGYRFTGNIAEAYAVISYFGRFDYSLSAMRATPFKSWIMLNVIDGVLDVLSIEELYECFRPLVNDSITLPPITGFSSFHTVSTGEIVDAIQIPIWGGIRRWLEFTQISRQLGLSVRDIYVSIRKNCITKSDVEPPFIASPGDWIVKDRFGEYTVFSPDRFDNAYRPIEIDLNAADFSDALMWLKEGKRIARRGWNAGGQFCWMVPEGEYPARMEAIKGHFPGDMVPYGAYFALKNAQGVVVPWVPSVGDLLATDWYVVE